MRDLETETVEPETKEVRIPRKQRGLTTVEYAVAGGLIVAALVAIFAALGDQIVAVLQAIIDALTTSEGG